MWSVILEKEHNYVITLTCKVLILSPLNWFWTTNRYYYYYKLEKLLLIVMKQQPIFNQCSPIPHDLWFSDVLGGGEL